MIGTQGPPFLYPSPQAFLFAQELYSQTKYLEYRHHQRKNRGEGGGGVKHKSTNIIMW